MTRMKIARWATAAAAAITAALSGSAALAAETPAGEDVPSVIASFEGGWIRLADGWGEAQACISDGVNARCYRSEAEMDAAEHPAGDGPIAFAHCALPTLKLYRGTNYGGGVLELTARGVYHNLSAYGFDNDTESYKIGPCTARFYDIWTTSGLYPGSTSANTWSATMSTGWANRISSVYIT